MPKYYHIHICERSGEDTLEKGFIKGDRLYISKKNSWWYRIWKKIGIDGVNNEGYKIYEITIPKELYTTSLYPKGKNKILKITKNNIKEYKKLMRQCWKFNGKGKGFHYLVIELTKRNIIGVDATSKFIRKHMQSAMIFEPEAFIWQKPSQIKIKKIKTVTI
jgi:hypothetical protein